MKKIIGYARGRRTVRIALDGMLVRVFTVTPDTIMPDGTHWREHLRDTRFQHQGKFHVEIDISRDPLFSLFA